MKKYRHASTSQVFGVVAAEGWHLLPFLVAWSIDVIVARKNAIAQVVDVNQKHILHISLA